MHKHFLLAPVKSREQKNHKFDNKTAKALLIVVLFTAVFLFVSPALAQTQDITGLSYAQYTGLGTQDIRITIANLIRIFFGLLGLVAVVIILYGGFLYMTSQGNPEVIQKAKKVLIGAFIGLLICLLAFAIVQFIITAILGGGGGGEGGVGGGWGGGGGALGSGIIESHYPARDAVNIPRNTKIAVTFKEAMCLTSIVNAETGNKINTDNIRIYPTPEGNAEPVYVQDVDASYTADLKTFVFRPVNYLGSSGAPMRYTVELTEDITKFGCSNPAFGVFRNYAWNFTVSTEIDNTPPQIKSVIPYPAEEVDRNNIVQINFTEPIDPMTLRGVVQLDGGNNVTVGSLQTGTYNYINVCAAADCSASNKFIAGEFRYSNQYQTVEFITNDLCGKNSCGGDVYCLPGLADISVLVKAASLIQAEENTAQFPYNGLVDMADNSLDGNLDTKSAGPGTTPYSLNDNLVGGEYVTAAGEGDNAIWEFSTTDKIDLIPPQISVTTPLANTKDVDPDDTYMIDFDKVMMSSTLKPNGQYDDGKNYITLIQSEVPAGFEAGYWLEKEEFTVASRLRTRALMKTSGLGENLNYGMKISSDVLDIKQNCYLPCSGPGCVRQEVPGGKPGQYVQGVPWTPPTGAYPTCNLTGTTYRSIGNFNVSYSEDGADKVFYFKAFSLIDSANTINDFYLYGKGIPSSTNVMKHGATFTQMIATNRAATMVYYSQSENKYYLVNFYGGFDSGGTANATITGGISVAISDDAGETKVTNAGLKIISSSQSWTRWMDGSAIYIGDGSADFSVKMNLTSFKKTLPSNQKCTDAECEWFLFGPEGPVKLTIPSEVTINFTK